MALIVTIKVAPSSGKNKWILDKSGMLKGYLKSPPERGLANQELIELLAEAVGIPKNKVSIKTGLSSRIKTVKIEHAISQEHLLKILGIEQQMPLFEQSLKKGRR